MYIAIAIYCIIPTLLQLLLGCCKLCTAFITSPLYSPFHQKSGSTHAVSTVPETGKLSWRNHRYNSQGGLGNLQLQGKQTVGQSGSAVGENQRASVHPHWRHWFHRAAPAERRLFFSFNQMLLSLVAPRLMRYQFDLMMHSVVAELFRKILVPAVAGGGSADSSSVLSSIGNILRLRGTQPATALPAPAPSAAAAPVRSAAPPAVDVQRLLDNAHKLIALQGLMHKPLESHSTSRVPPALSANNSFKLQGRGTQEHFANSSGKQKQPRRQSGLQSGGRSHSKATDTQIDQSANQSESPPSSKANTNADHPIHLAISTKDIISFLQNNFKQHQSPANYNSSALNTAKNTAAHQEETSSNINHLMNSLSFGRSHNSDINEAKVGGDSFFGENAVNVKSSPRHRTHRPEDFKMSHLTFIDTEVPNYGNQHLVRDQTTVDLQSSSANPSAVDPNRSQVGLIDPSLLNDKDVQNLKSDDLERANRWNDVLPIAFVFYCHLNSSSTDCIYSIAPIGIPIDQLM
ncbi:hypothetical protein TYRP_007934 [Tyrophagus putrescentiae]|nr:hypothetical protein TYRP_007934 [Tyrophagus putrescentiae]